LSFQAREIFHELHQQLIWFDEGIGVFGKKIEQVFRANEACQRLGHMEGIGPLIANALYAALHYAKEFKNGRQMSAWLELVPRQHSSGGKPLLLGISKRGSRYLRTLLIHGARAVIFRIKGKETRKAYWLRQLIARRGVNRATVASANKMARRAWVY